MSDDSGVFEPAEEFPNRRAAERYAALVGLDAVKARLLKEAKLLLDPAALDQWSERHHGIVLHAVRSFKDRIPLFVFAGDVGTGKTALAETFGDALARSEKLSVTLLPMSLTARGSGRVGEMTTLIAQAFRSVETQAAAGASDKRASSALVLLIDEGDALAQSRELAQMHHEDRAGVNALIRGVSRIAAKGLPIITILCTNRGNALDPALRRRAAAIFTFRRPNDEQREALLSRAFDGAGLSDADLQRLVTLTGEIDGRRYGYSHSDITTRLVPAAVLDAFPDRPVSAERLEDLLRENPPTAPFADSVDS